MKKHLIILFLLLIYGFSVWAQETSGDTLIDPNGQKKTFIDPYDSAFDISSYLFDLHGFLPIVSPITEPAVGIGAALAGVFFIPKKKKEGEPKRFKTPDITGFAGGYTKNKTWFAGAGYLGFWKDDHIRYRGVFGYADVNLKYYGEGDGYLEDHPISFNLKTYILLQQAVFRIKNSNFFIGGKYLYTNIKASLDNKEDYDWFDPEDFKQTSSGVGLITEYENFNNILSPSRGWRIHADYIQNFDFLGSSKNFGIFKFYSVWYQPVTNFWTSGLRLATYAATGDAPFYNLPFIDMRGIPVMRYQGKETLLIETEQEFTIKYRWSVVGFTGYGRTFNKNLQDETTGANAWNAGGGFRYLIARLLGLKMGLDAGFSKDSWSIYIVVGSAWLR
jgi:hypothetical protein